ncbi:hypothetical protein M427DRAFT_253041 [Gonapodya prolifera JEL478]|uniref:Uncharacterized protein n=1 Tax=Gonapodya prolifera (strain JEL478) TaxID=1344416 RepID=A0A139AL51_GONPJ|nr:hypothetical protein M427DRAFT_253041 [Gonapodya prolifera JEL478]|eukprot:KXS17521.1 hypothetical protein M427DRAFT_253041 [Gonapodya prolifera JEL478]
MRRLLALLLAVMLACIATAASVIEGCTSARSVVRPTVGFQNWRSYYKICRNGFGMAYCPSKGFRSIPATFWHPEPPEPSGNTFLFTNWVLSSL